MPPGRRGRPPGSTSTPKNPQQRLTFGPNASNKITKPSALSQSHSKKLSPTPKSVLSATVKDEIDASAPESPAAEKEEEVSREDVARKHEEEGKALPIRRNAKEQAEKVREAKRDVKEVEAMKVSEAQIKRYWTLKEEARIAPRVHQKGLGVHEKVLREFDLSSQFGPCIGIPRMRRWKRADGLGLRPPLEVLAVLMREEGAERAYVDTLMGNHMGLEA